VKVLKIKPPTWSRAEAQTLMENWLTAPHETDHGVIGQNDEMALARSRRSKARRP